MPDPAGVYNQDGALKFGTQVLTIKDSSGADVQYIADDFNLEADANWLVRVNQYNVPAAQAAQKKVRTGTATLQFPAADSKAPGLYAEFTAVEAGGANVTLIVAKVGQKYTVAGESKLPIDVREKLNP